MSSTLSPAFRAIAESQSLWVSLFQFDSSWAYNIPGTTFFLAYVRYTEDPSEGNGPGRELLRFAQHVRNDYHIRPGPGVDYCHIFTIGNSSPNWWRPELFPHAPKQSHGIIFGKREFMLNEADPVCSLRYRRFYSRATQRKIRKRLPVKVPEVPKIILTKTEDLNVKGQDLQVEAEEMEMEEEEQGTEVEAEDTEADDSDAESEDSDDDTKDLSGAKSMTIRTKPE